MIQRWRFAWAWFVGVTLTILPGCPGGGPGPQPTPPPPHTEQCQKLLDQGLPWCDKVEPPMSCGECVHNPSQDPRHCEQAPDCGGPGPLPEPQCPTFTDRGGSLRPMGDNACDCYFGEVWHPCEVVENQWFPIVPENQITGAGGNPGTMGSVVNKAMAELTGCYAGQEPCPLSLPEDLWDQAVCRKIHEYGFYCGRHVESPLGQVCPPGGGCSDQISVKASSFCDGGPHENYRIVAPGQDRVRWYPSAKLDAWNVDCTGARWPQDGGPTPPPPTPSPPPGDGCGDPHPRTCTQSQITVKRHGGPNSCRWDSTYQCTRSCDYCKAIGMGSIGGTIRCSCPVRPEGSPERAACERAVLGTQQWWCDGQKIDPEANPAQAVCCGHVKTCTEDGATCGEGDW